MKFIKHLGWRLEKDEVSADWDNEVLYFYENPIKRKTFWMCEDCDTYDDTKADLLERCFCEDNPLNKEVE